MTKFTKLMSTDVLENGNTSASPYSSQGKLYGVASKNDTRPFSHMSWYTRLSLNCLKNICRPWLHDLQVTRRDFPDCPRNLPQWAHAVPERICRITITLGTQTNGISLNSVSFGSTILVVYKPFPRSDTLTMRLDGIVKSGLGLEIAEVVDT